MTQNLGILPINLGPAKLQRAEHTLVHYFILTPLYEQFVNLNNKYDSLKQEYANNNNYSKELNNYEKIVKFLKSSITYKVENIRISNTNKNRIRKGLINGIGSIIKGITGNLDNNDGDRIYKILDHLRTNENNIIAQLQMQYSVSHSLIQNFNNTLKDIQHNEDTLKLKILELSELSRGSTEREDILSVVNIYHQLIILYNAILNTFQDIENSITFCKLGVVHPSIIRSKELFHELQKIYVHYKNQLPFELKFENILNFESIIKVNCKIDLNKVTYFLTIPVDFEDEYQLYYLLSLPTKYQSEFVTVVPNIKYLLKSKNDDAIKSLNANCVQGRPHHCSNQLLTSSPSSCEKKIIQQETSSNCTFTRLRIAQNHIEVIPELNQYLAVFPNEEKLQINCQNRVETKILQGVFLIKENICKLVFQGEELPLREFSIGKPMIIESPPLYIQHKVQPKFDIEIKKLNLGELSPNAAIPVIEDPIGYMTIPSFWTVSLYAVLVVLIAWYFIFKRNRASGNRPRVNTKGQDIPLQDINLPGDASF